MQNNEEYQYQRVRLTYFHEGISIKIVRGSSASEGCSSLNNDETFTIYYANFHIS